MCYSLRYNAPTMLPGSLEAEFLRFQATSCVHYTTSCNTQSSVPEDGRDQRPKHVEMIGIINIPLLLHLVGVYIIFIANQCSSPFSQKHSFVLIVLKHKMQQSGKKTSIFT